MRWSLCARATDNSYLAAQLNWQLNEPKCFSCQQLIEKGIRLAINTQRWAGISQTKHYLNKLIVDFLAQRYGF